MRKAHADDGQKVESKTIIFFCFAGKKLNCMKRINTMLYHVDFSAMPARLVEVMEPFKVVCAWCKKIIRYGESGKISHGICDLCFEVVLEQWG